MKSFQKLLERRDLWSIGVYRSDCLRAFFGKGCIEEVRLVGERGLRLGRDYKSVSADPFLFAMRERLYLFYEAKTDHHHGTIHALSMSARGGWVDHGLVHSEPFHLSYPNVFSLSGAVYMIPESAQSGSIRLYKSHDFPFGWQLVRVLINEPLRDPTLLFYPDGRIKLFATSEAGELRVFESASIDGTFWDTGVVVTEDPKFCRSAGQFFTLDDHLFRPAQDCSEVYGKKVHFLKVSSGGAIGYSEAPGGLESYLPLHDWQSRGTHHVSFAEFGQHHYMAVDGRGPDRRFNSLLLGAFRAADALHMRATAFARKTS